MRQRKEKIGVQRAGEQKLASLMFEPVYSIFHFVMMMITHLEKAYCQ
jgi:hypothetical protein